ncbi:MAG: hemin uptake protein HemP [Pirellulaceae bacterium]|nr:hemin uptake protein HemP [Pirellulaceae bacterium]
MVLAADSQQPAASLKETLFSRLPSRKTVAEKVSWGSEELLKGSKEIEITHGSETYRLRLTRNGKLILHK